MGVAEATAEPGLKESCTLKNFTCENIVSVDHVATRHTLKHSLRFASGIPGILLRLASYLTYSRPAPVPVPASYLTYSRSCTWHTQAWGQEREVDSRQALLSLYRAVHS